MTGGTRRAAAAVLLSLASLLLGAGTAAASDGPGIVIEPGRVEPGSRDVTLVLRLTEADPAAPTAGFAVFLPTGRPLVGVTAPAPPGWTADLTTTVLAAPAPSAVGPVREVVSAVAWTATGPPTGGPVEFTLHVGAMPEGAGPVRFRAVRTDTAGRTVEWADTWADGGPKPAHAALQLALGAPRPQVAAAGGHGDHHGGTAALAVDPATPAAMAATVGGLLAVTATVGGLMVALSRRQRRRLELATAERDALTRGLPTP